MPRTMRSISTPARLAAIEGVDDFRIDQRIAFAPDRRRLAGLGASDLLVDVPQQTLLQVNGDIAINSSPSGSA